MQDFEQLQRDAVSRRAFLQRMGAAGLGAAALTLLNGCGGGGSNGGSSHSTATPSATATSNGFPLALPGSSVDVKVLNYALTLEILEADLYRQALNYASGKALTAPLASDANSYSLAVPTSGVNAKAGFAYLRDFAYVEAAHRDFLTAQIQSLSETPVTANAKGYQFANGKTPPGNLRGILKAILPLEETGVRAYLGAVPYISGLSIAQAAGAIYSTEARHSAAIQYILGSDPGPNGDEAGVPSNTKVSIASGAYGSAGNIFEYFSTPTEVVAAIAPLIVS